MSDTDVAEKNPRIAKAPPWSPPVEPPPEVVPVAAVVPVPENPLLGTDPPKQPPALVANRLKDSEYARHMWIATPPPGTPYDAFFHEGYWAHIARMLTPWDRIDVHYEDEQSAFYLQLVVRSCGTNFARVVEIGCTRLDKVGDIGGDSEFRITFDSASRYGIVRRDSGQTLATGLRDLTEANRWLANHRNSGVPYMGRLA